MNLNELQDLSYRYDHLAQFGTATRQRQELAAGHFDRILGQLINLLRDKERPNPKKHTIADNFPAGGLTAAEPCMYCEDYAKIEQQRNDLLDACKYSHTLILRKIGQTTHAVALLEAAIAKGEA